MANRIKGITVEIGGDVTGLDKALNTVNKTIKDTQSQLKDVERLLKLDPTNTELLAQKQRLLKDAISNTKEKLDALKTAQEQAKQQLENGNLGQDKYDALQREIIETERKLKDLEDQSKKTNTTLAKISEAGAKLKDVGGKIKNVGDSLTKNVTVPIVAVGAAAMASFSEVDSAIDGMITKTGAAGKYLDKMTQAVENIATSIPTDFQTAADAVGEVSTRFQDVGEDLEGLSSYFVKFATINNTDVVSAVDNVQASMAAFGVETKDATLVLDALTQASQATGTDVNSLTNMMTQNAGVMKEMGYNYQETAFFMANLNKNGVDVGSTITGLKKAWQTASKDGKSMDTMLQEMNNTIKNAKTDQEAYQQAIDLFGAKAGPAIAQAVREGRLSFDAWAEDLEAFSGTVGDTFGATLDPIDQTTIIMNELKLTGADLAGMMQEMLIPILSDIRDGVKNVREWWGKLDESQKENIIRIAGIVAAIGPLLSIIGTIITTVGTLLTVVGAPVLGTIAAIIAAVTAVIAIGVLLWKNWDTIKAKAKQFVDNIKQKWESFKTITSAIFKAIGEDISKKWNEIKTKTSETWGKVKENTSKTWSAIKENVSTATSNLKDMVSQKLGNIKQAFEDNGGGIKGVIAATWTAIKEKWTLGFDTINTLTGGKLDGIKEKFKTVLENVKTTVQNAIEKIKGFFNFHFELPHIPIPHFSVVPEGWQLGDLLRGVIPHLDISWYKKAMDAGMIMNRPTIFGMQGNALLAGGEAGSETVVGTNSLLNMIKTAVENAGANYGDVNVFVQDGSSASRIAKEIGIEVNKQRRIQGSW